MMIMAIDFHLKVGIIIKVFFNKNYLNNDFNIR